MKKKGLSAIALLILSACGQSGGKTKVSGGTERPQDLDAFSSLAHDEVGVDPESLDAYDPQCLTSNSADACLVWKNSVAANGGRLSTFQSTRSDLSALQTQAVRLVGIQGEFLENPSISIQSTRGERLRKSDMATFNRAYADCSGGTCSEDARHTVSQVATYYWLTKMRLLMINRTGNFYAAGKHLQVNAFEPGLANAYYIPETRQITLGALNPASSRNDFEFSMSGEVVAHEYGHANLHFAQGRALSPSSSTPKNNNEACVSFAGCFGAINEGMADYHAAILFPEKSGVGEALMNSSNGLFGRNAAQNHNLTAPSAYNNSGGAIHIVGGLYAAIWWELRTHPTSDAQEIDSLFSEHLMLIQGNDTFVTILRKTMALDESLFGGKYSAKIEDEMRRRGLI